MGINDEEGRPLNAMIEVAAGQIILHSRSGTGRSARNPDYKAAFLTILTRLRRAGLAPDIFLDSRIVQEVPLSSRQVWWAKDLASEASVFAEVVRRMNGFPGSRSRGAWRRLMLRIQGVSQNYLSEVIGQRNGSPETYVRENEHPTAPQPRIFASGVYGSDYDLWSAWSFTDRGTRDKLAAILRPEDYVLAIGMMRETPEMERGRLLALIKIAPQLVDTPSLVEPGHWQRSLERFGERWMHAFPIRSVERFDSLPRRSDILPRIADQNLYRLVGRHYLELDNDEVERVLALPRTAEPNIYTTPASQFARGLLNVRSGPPPYLGVRTLTSKSGPAATYILELHGEDSNIVDTRLRLQAHAKVMKVGFSRDPARRLREINAYFPCEESLCWRIERLQWHDNEVNAWAMEQRIFSILAERQMPRIKGEIVTAPWSAIDEVWRTALATTERPKGPIKIASSA